MINSLKIRSFGNKYCVCDGIEKGKNPYENFAIGKQLSPWFDTWMEAYRWRKDVAGIIINQLEEAANGFTNESYRDAADFLDNFYCDK